MLTKILTFAALATLALILACGTTSPAPEEPSRNNQPANPTQPTAQQAQPQDTPSLAERINQRQQAAGEATPQSPLAVAEPAPAGQSPDTPTGVIPGSAAQQEPDPQAQQQQTGNTGQQGQANPAITLDPASMPGELSEVQLADIYAGMDLEQFAITPEQWEAIKQPQSTRNPGEMEGLGMPVLTPEQRNSHPYNHMIQPSPAGNDGNPPDKKGYMINPSTRHEVRIGPRAFLENPWFMPYYKYGVGDFTHFGRPYDFEEHSDTVTFGGNSTKHVLAEAISEAMETLIMDGVEPFPITYGSRSPEHALGILEHPDLPATQNLREYLNRSGAAHTLYFHQPISYWEFIHPTLPIVRVIVEGNSGMPLARPGETPGNVVYQVGFVVTFQNRWQSFDDPNRWLTRFRNTTVRKNVRSLDPEVEGPPILDYEVTWMNPERDIASEAEHGHRFWHYTDYMQHRIIGPVWVKVVHSDIMEQGQIASATPRINHWAAPGPIVPNEHLMTQLVRRTKNEGERSVLSWAGYEHLKLRPAAGSPNPGFPLPYHVTATGLHQILMQYHDPNGTYDRHALPGSNIWNEYCQHQYFRDAFNCPP